MATACKTPVEVLQGRKKGALRTEIFRLFTYTQRLPNVFQRKDEHKPALPHASKYTILRGSGRN